MSFDLSSVWENNATERLPQSGSNGSLSNSNYFLYVSKDPGSQNNLNLASVASHTVRIETLLPGTPLTASDPMIFSLCEDYGGMVKSIYTEQKAEGYVCVTFFDCRNVPRVVERMQGMVLGNSRVKVSCVPDSANPFESSRCQGLLLVKANSPNPTGLGMQVFPSLAQVRKFFERFGDLKSCESQVPGVYLVEFYCMIGASSAMGTVNKGNAELDLSVTAVMKKDHEVVLAQSLCSCDIAVSGPMMGATKSSINGNATISTAGSILGGLNFGDDSVFSRSASNASIANTDNHRFDEDKGSPPFGDHSKSLGSTLPLPTGAAVGSKMKSSLSAGSLSNLSPEVVADLAEKMALLQLAQMGSSNPSSGLGTSSFQYQQALQTVLKLQQQQQLQQQQLYPAPQQQQQQNHHHHQGPSSSATSSQGAHGVGHGHVHGNGHAQSHSAGSSPVTSPVIGQRHQGSSSTRNPFAAPSAQAAPFAPGGDYVVPAPSTRPPHHHGGGGAHASSASRRSPAFETSAGGSGASGAGGVGSGGSIGTGGNSARIGSQYGGFPSSMDADRGVPRGHSMGMSQSSGSGGSDASCVVNIEDLLSGREQRTTLMIRNIPNKYTQKLLLATLDETHFRKYDFFYLPIDFKNRCNVGYAFLNLFDPMDIVSLVNRLAGKRWGKFNSQKVCAISFARIQGKNDLVRHFQNSSLMLEDKQWKPVLFHSSGIDKGLPEEFPEGSEI